MDLVESALRLGGRVLLSLFAECEAGVLHDVWGTELLAAASSDVGV